MRLRHRAGGASCRRRASSPTGDGADEKGRFALYAVKMTGRDQVNLDPSIGQVGAHEAPGIALLRYRAPQYVVEKHCSNRVKY